LKEKGKASSNTKSIQERESPYRLLQCKKKIPRKKLGTYITIHSKRDLKKEDFNECTLAAKSLQKRHQFLYLHMLHVKKAGITFQTIYIPDK
jgi:hypothetical protein